jgi:hypothetical protein
MKAFIKDQKICLTDPLPENLQDGDEIEISIVRIKKRNYPFSTFNLGIKDEYLNRECLYELVHQNPTDYVEISHQLYAGQQLEEIFARAKQNWQG